MAAFRSIAQEQDPLGINLKNPPIPIRKRERRLPSAVAGVIHQALLAYTRQHYQTAGEFWRALACALE
jgi:hypothetical protein